MTDETANLILEHLRAMRRDMADVRADNGEIKRRLSQLEAGQADIIKILGNLAAADANQQLSADRLSERLDRFERRLELPEA